MAVIHDGPPSAWHEVSNRATKISGYVQFGFITVAGASASDVLWVENITKAALTNDIFV